MLDVDSRVLPSPVFCFAEEQLKVANKTVEDQKIELRELRGELRDTQDELEGKCDEVSQLQGKVVNIRSHALKLEDELRSMSGGEASNVHRTAELQKELRMQKTAAGEILGDLLWYQSVGMCSWHI